MTRSVPLPKITECFAPAPRFVSLNDTRIAQVLLAFVAVAALAVGHIYLRFANQDIMLQHRQLQEQQSVLVREITRLEQQTASLMDSGRLKEFGIRDMRMVETPVLQRKLAAVPASIANKYGAAGASDRLLAASDLMEAEQEQQGVVKRILLSIVDVNNAIAAPVER
jgi:cell division protein FtsL